MTDKHSQIRTVHQDPGLDQRVFTFKVTYFVWLLFGLLESLIALRIGLKLIAANPNSPFAAFIYSFTDIFLIPFAGLTTTPTSGGMVLEISSFIAIFVYALLAWAIERLIWVVFYRPQTSSVDVVQTTTHEHSTK